ncbi:MAG: M48 family metalloprotease [Halioglobus sp.]|uniref:Peptidase, M48 family n=1 Tax=uncultured marine bacterium 463 TaxID=257394 RepID=Q6SGP2_9BACT|nr:peptidase, M48 family [uncultured marine bacterium 463]MDG1389487.1 M48 family metalloprotease [Halioglobus sp.]MDG2327918.1 M48 family metalloprotease [Halioglobus sp.]
MRLPVFLLLLTIVFAASNSMGASKGEEEHQKIIDSGQIYDDPELQAYINRIGQSLVANSDKPKGKFTFTVLDSGVINAFAAPNGFIYVSRGLLPFMDSEEELAGVIGHEIGHVTGNHHGRRGRADITSKIVATTAYILTGSGDLAEASTMYGAELISGFGRDMELEADGLGAEYMYKTGYDPQALLEVIGVLKDQEQFQRVKARATGKPAGTYHGLYASHPRNDKRLQTVIRKAGELDLDEYVESPEQAGEFRRHIEGLVWGESVQGQREENRYYHSKLAFTFEHPEGWSVKSSSKAVVASSADGRTSLTITLRRKDSSKTPESVLKSSASGDFSEAAALEQAGLQGYCAIASSNGVAKRLAVIDYNYTYLLQGESADFAANDPVLLEIIKSFRPTHPKEKQAGTPRYIHYIQVPRGATFASIASSIRIPYAEDQLRLLNGMYPRGEPRTGDWIKVIR